MAPLTKDQRKQLHIAQMKAQPLYIPPELLTPEKRAYVKRFGSRPAKKRREVVPQAN